MKPNPEFLGSETSKKNWTSHVQNSEYSADEFMHETALARISHLERTILKDTKDDTEKKQKRVLAIEFITNLEYWFKENKSINKNMEGFEFLNLCKKYINDTSSNQKLILEHLALHMPTML